MKIKFCPNCPQPQYNKNMLEVLYNLALMVVNHYKDYDNPVINDFIKEYEKAIEQLKGGIK